MSTHLSFLGALLAASTLFALLEIQIEGEHGWASGLPTWRRENRWTRHDERALHAVVLRRTAPLDELLSAALLALAALIGFSRCYLGVHYPSDVAAGWLLALGASGLATLLGV